QVKQAAGSGDNNVGAGGKAADLRLFADAAEDEGVAQLEVAAVEGDVAADLDRELARGRENQGAGKPGGARPRVGRKPVQDRERESGRLARAGLRHADQVAALEQRR